MEKVTERNPIYRIKNQHQVNTLRESVLVNYGEFALNVVDILRFINYTELSPVLALTKNDAEYALDSGVLVLKTSGRSLPKKIIVTPELRVLLQKQLLMLHVEAKFLFSMLGGRSHRAKNNDKPISRQSVWQWFSSARNAVVATSRDSGISDSAKLTPSSLLLFEQGSGVLLDAIDNLVTRFGDDISEQLLSMLTIEYKHINSNINNQ